MALLQQEELLGAPVEIAISRVVPRVARVVLVGVGPGVGEVDLACVRVDVREGVEDVGEVALLDVRGEVTGMVVAGVDGPVDEVED